MRVTYKHGTKERLVEMMNKVNKITLNEEVLPENKKNTVIEEFMNFADNKLGLEGDLPEVTISYDPKEASGMKSFGIYTPSENTLRVVAANRNLADVLRTLAHEFVHHKQRKEGKLNPNSNEDGSEVENEANAQAGVLMREFGRENPIIFE